MASPDSTIIPNWMVIAGSISGLALGVIKILSCIIQLTKLPELEVTLTKEIFFRLVEQGESVFTNCVLITRNGSVEITNVEFTLNKTSGSSKSFRIAPVNIGTKVANPPNPYAAHNFTSKSCRMYLSENSPTHVLFLSVLEEYSKKFSEETSKFNSEVTEYANELRSKISDIQLKESEYLEKINLKLNSLESEAKGRFLSHIQLESGNYELKVRVLYTKLGMRILKKDGVT